MGLMIAPDNARLIMETVLEGLDVGIDINDIAIFCNLDGHLQQILQCCNSYSIMASNVTFSIASGRSQKRILVIDAYMHQTLQEMIEALPPRKTSQLRSI